VRRSPRVGWPLAEALTGHAARVTAIDLSPTAIEVAKPHAASGQLAIDYRVQSAAELADEAAGNFQWCCMELIERPGSDALVATLARLLQPGGSLFVATINRTARYSAIVAAEYLLQLVPRGTQHTRGWCAGRTGRRRTSRRANAA
jgi:2-polyprenyl-6-hydroxyphenyl methylase/3-demethylubiquinone-9 3-methyltransferase